MDLSEEFYLTRVEGEDFTEVVDLVIKEFPLTIVVNQQELVTLACSPVYLDELAVGYLYSEGLITHKTEVESISIIGDKVFVELKDRIRELLPLAHQIITSGCGRSTIHTDLNGHDLKKIRSEIKVQHERIYELSVALNKCSALFLETGGVHNTLLAAAWGGEEIFREDVGRHNAVDKLVGYMVMNELVPDDKILLTTGRISMEILLKTARRQIPILISRSAPTDLAIHLAYRLGITLIGFARGKRMNIYTHSDRIV